MSKFEEQARSFGTKIVYEEDLEARNMTLVLQAAIDSSAFQKLTVNARHSS
jgi:hypothetical protein